MQQQLTPGIALPPFCFFSTLQVRARCPLGQDPIHNAHKIIHIAYGLHGVALPYTSLILCFALYCLVFCWLSPALSAAALSSPSGYSLLSSNADFTCHVSRKGTNTMLSQNFFYQCCVSVASGEAKGTGSLQEFLRARSAVDRLLERQQGCMGLCHHGVVYRLMHMWFRYAIVACRVT